MPDTPSDFSVRLARTEEDLRAAQALRYQVFVTELGGDGELVDHAAGLERKKKNKKKKKRKRRRKKNRRRKIKKKKG